MAAPALLIAFSLGAQQQEQKPAEPVVTPQNVPQAVDKDGLPPEEDTAIATQNYVFNPLQAKKEIAVGNQYFKRGAYRAAAGRFEEATKWNVGDAEAWLRLGEAQEKLHDAKAAREAYGKYLALGPDAKTAAEVKKKLGSLAKR
jgi:tetratricopeptide (TPR) repeat protein